MLCRSFVTKHPVPGNALTVSFIKDTGFDPDVVGNAVSMTAVAIVFAPFLIALGRKFGVSYYLGFMTLGEIPLPQLCTDSC